MASIVTGINSNNYPSLPSSLYETGPYEKALGLARDLDFYGVMECVYDCEFTQSQLFELAKVCAQLKGAETAGQIETFKLVNETDRFEIAKLCAQEGLDAILDTIGGFQLEEMHRLEVVKICMQHEHGSVLSDLPKFNLGEPCRFQLAKFCARQNFSVTRSYLPEFNLEESHRLEIAKLCVDRGCQGILQLVGECALSGSAKKEFIHHAILSNPQNLALMEAPWHTLLWGLDVELCTFKSNLIPEFHSLVDNLAEKISKIPNPEARKQALILAGVIIYMISNESLSLEEANWVKENLLLEEIFSFEAPGLRHFLLILAINACKMGREQFGNQNVKSLLLRLPLACLQSEGVDLFSLKIKEHALKDTKVLAFILEALGKLFLVPHDELSPVQKTKLIEQLSKNLVPNAKNLLVILSFNEAGLLKNEQNLDLDFAELAERAFYSAIPFPQIGNLAERYEKTFCTYRLPDALRVYAANLKKLLNPKVMESLGDFASSVLTETYLQSRYDLERNPHLKQIQAEHPALLQSWRALSAPEPLVELLSSSSSASSSSSSSPSSMNMHAWLKTKIVDDQHMELDYVKDYLLFSEQDKKKQDLLEAELRAKLIALTRELKGVSFDPTVKKLEKEGLSFLSIQKKCIQLTKCPATEQLKLLREIKQFLRQSAASQAEEFIHDVDGLIKSLLAKQTIEGLEAWETESPEDLLLSGTEVHGSCQRIDGDPDMNQGLLGYLMHGQTRMIAVKKKTGEIVARRLLRLLLDERKPVLFLERLYANQHDSRIEQALLVKAKQISQRLLCPLTSIDMGGAKYGKPLHSLGGSAAFEYVDGAMGVMKNGKFEIANSELIFDPKA